MGYLSVQEFLETVAALRGTPSDAALVLARRGVHSACAPQRIDPLSARQSRQLCLCAALCEEPRVLLLDEPETGLDAQATHELRTRLATLAARGHAVLIASHSDAWLSELGVGDARALRTRATGQLRIVAGEVHGPPL